MGCHPLVTPCPPTPGKATAAPALTAAPQRVALPVSGFAAPAIASSLGSRERGHGAGEGLARTCAWPQRWCKDAGPHPMCVLSPGTTTPAARAGDGVMGTGEPPVHAAAGQCPGHRAPCACVHVEGLHGPWLQMHVDEEGSHGPLQQARVRVEAWEGAGTAALACTAGG